MDKLYDSETGCCKRFNPKPWDNKLVKFDKRLFLKDSMKTLFHMPLGFGKLMVRDMEKISAAGALAKEPLMLYDCKSAFSADIYIAVSKNVPRAKMERISGTFLSKVFEGHFKNSGKWVKEMQAYAKSKRKEIKKLYFFYTTCPACAKVYGKNYVVLLAQI